MTRKLPPYRFFYAAGFLLCAALLAAAYYMQFKMHLEPCPLCIFQRLFFAGIALLCLIAFLHNPGKSGILIYGLLSTALSLGGGAVAARQVWLQHLPADQVPECGPGLNYMLEVFPLGKTITMVLKGSGECAKVDWTFLSMSIAEWSLVVFIALALSGIFLTWKRNG